MQNVSPVHSHTVLEEKNIFVQFHCLSYCIETTGFHLD